jgi:hypothetical protein
LEHEVGEPKISLSADRKTIEAVFPIRYIPRQQTEVKEVQCMFMLTKHGVTDVRIEGADVHEWDRAWLLKYFQRLFSFSEDLPLR